MELIGVALWSASRNEAEFIFLSQCTQGVFCLCPTLQKIFWESNEMTFVYKVNNLVLHELPNMSNSIARRCTLAYLSGAAMGEKAFVINFLQLRLLPES